MRISGLMVAAVLAAGAAAAEETPPAAVTIDAEFRVAAPLTTARAKAFRGLEVFVDRRRGNCVACHTNFDVSAMQFLGNVGPSLDWVGDRLDEGQIRAILVDAKQVFGEGTVMPAFYSTRGGARVREDLRGTPVLTAQEIEDIVAYLSELRQR